ncbi:DMT family transporter [Bacteroidales bacterium OttesenSCG-928-C19]|nr:DMT family transporter [Bacteroidales bacterium OttesenSCG-928-C19]
MNEKNYRAHLAILTTNIIFGINIPISKNVMQEYLSPYSLTFFRMFGACIIFWIASLFLKREKIQGKDLLFIFFAGMFGIFINQFSFIQGLSLASPINASIIVTFTPIMTMLVSFLFLKEPITWKKAIGVLMGAAGAITLVVTNRSAALAGNGSIWGDIFCLVSCLAYAIYLTAFRWLIDKYHPVTLMKWMFLFSAIVSIPFCYNSVSAINYAEIPAQAYLQIAYVIVGATFITYLLIPIGQKSLRPTTLTMYNYLQPLITACIAVIFGLDTFGFVKTLAAVLIFSGVYMVIKSKSREQLEKEKSKL